LHYRSVHYFLKISSEQRDIAKTVLNMSLPMAIGIRNARIECHHPRMPEFIANGHYNPACSAVTPRSRQEFPDFW
jgi:hypothetical protein